MSEENTTAKIELESAEEAYILLGNADSHIRLLEEQWNVSIVTRGEAIMVSGETNIEIVQQIIKQLLKVIRKGIQVSERDVAYASKMAKAGKVEYFADLFDEEIARNTKGKAIRVKTLGQREYIDSIRKNDLVFGIGPAGTGKTYLAVVMAVNALH
ncbi:hypothetical protein ACA29_05575 [Lederbergia galactosidilytica]|uniref:PhoH-like protein n=1 Tax=Lederbergia galactosidilytica TaxID=217031 RepID=A0A0Q9Y1P1_9BACI|nr:hypothetical protein ACA29_05575 [Lederbergia galactosidilytica]